ncbi:vitamin B12 transporter [Halopseudomonas sabulinigri]|uniref:Vitamin B12 transporter n=1 Tax=Halopseudomonas sabulinigri TaxID=472181 RepID=A0A1H1NFB0_9GAMM|nr:TonB-dependent vitamin B12 receptor [Halopseudomonas sabulinigri]SDR97490.1 vitamin B12 transporter [Halopseudomonas sabulinigri]
MKTFFRAPVALGLVGLSSLSLAHTLSLDDQVVTATRTAQSGAQSIAATSVFDRNDIERLQVTSVDQLLRRVPGVNLVNTGGPGKNTTISIRGASTNQVLVLIDGVRIGSATTGDAALQNLPVEQIERIEVVRGPRSSLYGSEAIGGVIQIFTRRGGDGGAQPYFSTTVGSAQHLSGTAGVSGGDDKAWYNLGASSLKDEGIDARPSREVDHDGYRELSANLSGGYRFANGLTLDGNILQVDSHNDYDSGFKANADNVTKVYGARARFSPLSAWDVTLQAGRSEDKTDTFNGNTFNTRIDTRRDSFGWQNDLRLAEGQLLTLGYDWLDDEVNGTGTFAEDGRDNHGVYAQYLAQFGRHEVQLSLRHDDNEQFGAHNTGSLGYGLQLTDALRAVASYGTAFKAPTFNQLYYPGFGNADLEPESSKSLEAGLQGWHDWGNWSATAFRNEIDDLIAYFNSGAGLQAQNIDKATINGLELEAATQLLGWSWQGNLTLQDPKNASNRAGQGDLLPRRAEQVFNLDVDRRFGRIGVGASLHAEGRRWDNAANSTDLPGYNTLDLRATYWLSHAWRVQAQITNLFDTDYETAATYQQPGRAGYLTLRYQAM